MTSAGRRGGGDRPRFLIDLRWMIPGEAGGLENVALAFLTELFAMGPVADTTLIVPDRLLRAFRSVVPAEVGLISRDGPGADLRAVMHLASGRRFFPPVPVGRFDVAYSLNGRLHPDLRDIPALVLVADLQHLALPDLFDPVERDGRSEASRVVARRAHRIVTISEFSRSEILARLGVPPERVSVSHLGIDADFREPPGPDRVARCLEVYGLAGQPYLFLPAQLWPHKNHAAVIRAMGLLAERSGASPLLVSTGGTETAYAPTLRALIDASPVRNRIRLLGRIPREDLAPLYGGALALVFCSRYEGFGLPVAEAMAAGCPVIASDSSSIPEIAGQAGLLVDPDDPEAIANAIAALTSDEPLRERLVGLGRERSRRFSWSQHAREILALAFQVAGRAMPDVETPAIASAPLSLSWPASAGPRWREAIYPAARRRLIDRLRRRRAEDARTA